MKTIYVVAVVAIIAGATHATAQTRKVCEFDPKKDSASSMKDCTEFVVKQEPTIKCIRHDGKEIMASAAYCADIGGKQGR